MHNSTTTTQQADAAPQFMNDYPGIIDDGDCTDHGHFLPKQPLHKMQSVGNSGVGVVEIPIKNLVASLSSLGKKQKQLLTPNRA